MVANKHKEKVNCMCKKSLLCIIRQRVTIFWLHQILFFAIERLQSTIGIKIQNIYLKHPLSSYSELKNMALKFSKQIDFKCLKA